MDEQSIKILEFIRDNPLCESGEMDGFILKDLEDMGYIEAIDVTTDDSNGIPEFIEIRITLIGKELISEYHSESGIDNVNSQSKPNWHDKALGKITISVLSIILASLALLLLSRHFGIG